MLESNYNFALSPLIVVFTALLYLYIKNAAKSESAPGGVYSGVGRDYQMVTRFSLGTNIGSDSVMPKASYQASMCGICPLTRHMPSW